VPPRLQLRPGPLEGKRVIKKISRVYGFLWRAFILFIITGSLFFPVLHMICPSFKVPGQKPAAEFPSSDTFGPFAVSCPAPGHDSWRMKIAFDELSVSNGSAGLFKTALFQTLHLTNLRLYTIAETPALAAPAPVSETADSAVDPMRLSPTLLDRMLQLRRDETLHALDWSVPDVGRAANLSIDGFIWRIGQGDADLAITSRLALLDHRQPDELLLKGHVVLQSPGRVVESNHVIYDMQARRFRVPGTCMLTANNEKSLQRNIGLDMRLNFEPPLAVQSTGENLCQLNPLP